MKQEAFPISLNVKHFEISKQFYENLGFIVFAGSLEKKYLIMKNGNALVGLFQGNILTFNLGWDENASKVEGFDDVREIQKQLKNKSIKLDTEVSENSSGAGSLMLTHPDGNVTLLDQHL